MGGGIGGMSGQGMMMGMDFGIDEGFYSSTPAEQPAETEPVDIEQLLKWLDELWLDEEVREAIDADTWLRFIESLKDEI